MEKGLVEHDDVTGRHEVAKLSIDNGLAAERISFLVTYFLSDHTLTSSQDGSSSRKKRY